MPLMKALVYRVIATLVLLSMLAGLVPAAERFGVFKSTDRGRSWIHSSAGIPAALRINAFGSLDRLVIAGTDSGIFISRDEANSWQPATGEVASSGRVVSFGTLGRKVFAGTSGGGMLVSLDGGASWVRNGAFPSANLRCLLALQGKLYAGTDRDGVFVSGEEGQVWAPLSQGLPGAAQVFAMASVEGTLFAGLYSKGLYVWNHQERHWTKTGPVSPLVLAGIGHTLVAGHNPGGLYWSGDLGITWSKGMAGGGVPLLSGLSDVPDGLFGHAAVWELAAGDELVFAGASAGIYYSEDRGHTWTQARTGLPAESPGIAFLVKRSFVLAAAEISTSH